MPYIGKSPVGGGFHKLDNLTASATATYALTLGSAAYYPETANQLLVSLNGVIQAPQDSFTVSGSNLVFDSALTASDSIDFVVALGDVLSVGSVTDGAITTAKLGNGAVTAAKLAAGVGGVAGISSSSTSGTAFSINANNIVTNSVPVGFSAALESNFSTDASTYYRVPLKTNISSLSDVLFDTHSGWDNTNNYYTIPNGLDGYWFLYAAVEFNNINTACRAMISSGTSVGTLADFIVLAHDVGANGSGNSHPKNTIIKYCTAGEILNTQAFQNHSNGTVIQGSSSASGMRSYMQGWRLF